METGLDKEKLLEYKAVALKHLSDPAKLRLLVVCGLVLLAVVGVWGPLSGQIKRQRALLAGEKRRLEAVNAVASLRREVDSYRGRIAEDADTNDWVQYVLNGLRKARVRLRDMSSRPAQVVGPYRTVTLAIEVEGTYAEMKEFMEWLEGSDRLLRVDSAQIEKHPENLVMKLTLLGLVHRNAKPA